MQMSACVEKVVSICVLQPDYSMHFCTSLFCESFEGEVRYFPFKRIQLGLNYRKNCQEKKMIWNKIMGGMFKYTVHDWFSIV